ncbi:MAG: hypothetical protein Q8P39_00445, partial [Candidatus Yanofskybacteria bacterium]|nr:hypothetical protein [Candidatus Yanofskybacteria bacterium]
MKWINIKILSQKIIKNPLFLAFLAMLILEYGAYRVFSGKENVPILAAISTGLVVMFGYFATHYFTI